MEARLIHAGLNGLERRPILAIAVVYGLFLALAGLILALAVARGARARPPFLAEVAVAVACSALSAV